MAATLEVISPSALGNLRKAGPVALIDVRTPMEFRQIHADEATNVPLDQFDPAAVLAAHPEETLYLICRSGARSAKACEKLLAVAGSRRIVNVDGGTLAWEAAGLPVVRGRKSVSLERQVRIAAGSLVLAGVALAYFVDPWLIGLSAFIGAGLVFSGVTDTCGMGLALAKMPWNRVVSTTTGASC
jgi:rhodanese-related sulfurtransferase